MGALKMDTSSPAAPQSPAHKVNWRGRSGAFYTLVAERLESFALSGSQLYLLARGNGVLWIGSMAELVADATNRDRFRKALAEADSVFHVEESGAEAERLALAWDLEGGERMGALWLA